MTLDEMVRARRAIPWSAIAVDRALAVELQDRLALYGILDPPSDGIFGPVSYWALDYAARRLGSRRKRDFDAALAASLLATEALLPPLKTPPTLAGRILKAMLAAGYWVGRHPSCVNIVYVEGLSPDGRANDDAPNAFNDLRLVLRITRAGNPKIAAAWEATTEPGHYYTRVKRLASEGAARIAFGQYQAWSVGTHAAGSKSAHEALVQTKPVSVHRDGNEDFERTGDAVQTGLFGINQHWGFDLPQNDIGRASAGCLVGRSKSGHREFMALCKADPRYAASHSYRFSSSILPASAL